MIARHMELGTQELVAHGLRRDERRRDRAGWVLALLAIAFIGFKLSRRPS